MAASRSNRTQVLLPSLNLKVADEVWLATALLHREFPSQLDFPVDAIVNRSPVIGVPIPSTSLNGLDSLLATVQMPVGIPVATVAIGKPGASNAGILAAQILALASPDLGKKMAAHKEKLASGVAEKSRKLQATLNAK